MASSTKNIKGDRKVVRVTLAAPEVIFKIPDGLDLEDETVVENWYYRWGTMYIKYVGREEVEKVEAYYEAELDGYAQEIEIIAAWDASVDYSEDEDEDEE